MICAHARARRYVEENELLQRKMDERSEDVHKLLLGKRQHMEELQRCQEELEEAQVLRIVFTLSLLCCCARRCLCRSSRGY